MTKLLEVNNLTKHYTKAGNLFHRQQHTIALNDVSFTLENGQTLALVGETGSGKSTLAKLLVGIEKPDSGNILLSGAPLQGDNYRQRNHFVRFIFQHAGRSLNPAQRVGEMLDDVLQFNTVMDSQQRQQNISQTLKMLGLLDEHRHFYPYMFSSGQLQRIALARALILNPKLLILDEALTALDPSLRAQMINLLLDLQQQSGLAYIFISNHLRLARHISDQLLVLHQGKMLDYGATADVFANPVHDYTRKLINSASGG